MSNALNVVHFFMNYYHDVDEGDNDDKDEIADGGVGSDFNNKKYC